MPADVRIKKDELLEVLMKNRDTHRAKFLAAQDAYRAVMIEEFDRRLKDARDGRRIDVHFRMPVPEDHTDDYDREIQMLKMETSGHITLSSREFDQLVMDNWGWKAAFAATNSVYAVE